MSVIDKLHALPSEQAADLGTLSRREKIAFKRRVLESRKSIGLRDVEIANQRETASRKTSGYYIDKVRTDERLAGFRSEEKELLALLRVDPADSVRASEPAQVREPAERVQHGESDVRALERRVHAAAARATDRGGPQRQREEVPARAPGPAQHGLPDPLPARLGASRANLHNTNIYYSSLTFTGQTAACRFSPRLWLRADCLDAEIGDIF